MLVFRASFPYQPASHNLKIALEHNVDRLRVGNVLLIEDTGGQSVFVVAILDVDRSLNDDRAVIQFLIHKMDATTRHFHSVGKSLLLSFEPRERWKERRMDIENPSRELLHKPGREQAHVSGEADQVNVTFL